jgi:uncharacterized membrane protein (DUF4010 family)
MAYPWFNFAIALGLGLLIGLERERSKGEGPTRRPAGIRTFALATLLGAIAAYLGQIPLLMVAAAGMALLTGLSYLRDRSDDPGLTTETALLAAPLLGGLAMSAPLLASGLSVAVVTLLAAKPPLHRFVKTVLSEAEVNDGLVLTIASVVIWPQIPDRPVGPWQALNPSKIWLLVVLIMSVGAAGHILGRTLGARFGLPVSGFVAGFVSSTAAIGSMGVRAASEPESLNAAVAGAALSSVATFVLMASLLFVASRSTFDVMMPALATGGVVAAIYGLVLIAPALKVASRDKPLSEGAFSIKSTLIIAGTMSAMLVVAAGVKDRLGEAGIIAAAAIAGVVDAHATAISIASLAASGQIQAADAVAPILAGMTTNAFSKCLVAATAGSRVFALRVILGVALSLAATWAVALFTAMASPGLKP